MTETPTEGKRLWLWKINNDYYIAYDSPYPCDENGDPKTVGEPVAMATYFPCDTDAAVQLTAVLRGLNQQRVQVEAASK